MAPAGYKLVDGMYLSPEDRERLGLQSSMPQPRRPTRADTPERKTSGAPEGAGVGLIEAPHSEKAAETSAAASLGRSIGQFAAGAERATNPGVAAPRRRRRSCCSAAWRRWLFWNLGTLLLVLLFFSGSVSALLMSLSVGTAALASVATSAGDVLSAGANASTAAMSIAVGALGTASTAASEAYRGVDIYNISVERSYAKAMATSQAGLHRWVLGGGGEVIPEAMRLAMANVIESAVPDVPLSEISREWMQVRGSILRFSLRLRWRGRREIVAAFVCFNATFQADWTNPTWEWLGFHVESESRQIILTVVEAIRGLDGLPGTVYLLDDATLSNEFGILPLARRWAGLALGLALIVFCVMLLALGTARKRVAAAWRRLDANLEQAEASEVPLSPAGRHGRTESTTGSPRSDSTGSWAVVERSPAAMVAA